ncbi:hypothetical protein CDAR_198501 [Caerostris darwini]|uniref:Uncharacterized protein n=1 Tax=Caerostris darwini TaxID=1538125 RepID=A0AAV4W546_9ARAC|nr:hypothetical protein CDAR_198501 [Caerostris darwini]
MAHLKNKKTKPIPLSLSSYPLTPIRRRLPYLAGTSLTQFMVRKILPFAFSLSESGEWVFEGVVGWFFTIIYPPTLFLLIPTSNPNPILPIYYPTTVQTFNTPNDSRVKYTKTTRPTSPPPPSHLEERELRVHPTHKLLLCIPHPSNRRESRSFSYPFIPFASHPQVNPGRFEVALGTARSVLTRSRQARASDWVGGTVHAEWAVGGAGSTLPFAR